MAREHPVSVVLTVGMDLKLLPTAVMTFTADPTGLMATLEGIAHTT